jgi:hypothetical protein
VQRGIRENLLHPQFRSLGRATDHFEDDKESEEEYRHEEE